MKGSKKRFKGQTIGEGFIAMPYSVLNGASFMGLSAKAVKLLLDLASQYRGDNNGDLAASWKLMRPRGWRSEDTLNKAKQELLQSELIFEARKGRRPNVCSLYALTWRPFNPSPKHDYGPAAFVRGAYRLKDSLVPTKLAARPTAAPGGRSLNTPVGVARNA